MVFVWESIIIELPVLHCCVKRVFVPVTVDVELIETVPDNEYVAGCVVITHINLYCVYPIPDTVEA